MTRRNFTGNARHYITASEEEIRACLRPSGYSSKFVLPIDGDFAKPDLPDELNYEEAAAGFPRLSKTNLKNSFVGDMLPVWETHPIVDFV